MNVERQMTILFSQNPGCVAQRTGGGKAVANRTSSTEVDDTSSPRQRRVRPSAVSNCSTLCFRKVEICCGSATHVQPPSTPSSIFIKGGVSPPTDIHGNMLDTAAKPMPLNRVPPRRTSRESKSNPSKHYFGRGLCSNFLGTNRSHRYNTRTKRINAGYM